MRQPVIWEIAAKGMRPRIRANLHYLRKVQAASRKKGEREAAHWHWQTRQKAIPMHGTAY